MGIGLKLLKLIEASNTNANELANKINVSPQTIYSMIKRDSKKADIEVLLKIADFFGVSAEYFVYDNTPKNPSNSITREEMDYIVQYRSLDDEGRETIMLTIEREARRTKQIRETQARMLAYQEKLEKISRPTVSNTVEFAQHDVNAAHERTDIKITDEMQKHDNDIMDDENF